MVKFKSDHVLHNGRLAPRIFETQHLELCFVFAHRTLKKDAVYAGVFAKFLLSASQLSCEAVELYIGLEYKYKIQSQVFMHNFLLRIVL